MLYSIIGMHKAQRDEEQTSKNKMENSDIYRNYT